MNMKKKIILILILSLLSFGHAFADPPLKVYLFDQLVNMDNPVIVNGNTLVPLRVLFESLGSSVTWDEQNKTANAKKGNTTISIQIGNNEANKNGNSVTLEEPAQIINDKTYVPLRFVAESFGQDVKWDQSNNAIYIGKSLEAKDISKIASNAVVYIETADKNNKLYASGSGFIVDKDGIVVTNYHVINNAYSAMVKLADGRTYNVTKVINYDVSLDIAVLKINSFSPMPTVSLGDSNKIENGDKIYAIGSPKGYENTISAGLISNKKRTINQQALIQLSAEITHGSSGGALFNDRAEVIGITSSGVGEADLNFAIPINVYKNMTGTKNILLSDIAKNEHTIVYSDAVYEGDIINGKKEGVGSLKVKDGTYVIGNWKNDKLNGIASITYPAGGSYTGDFIDDKKVGYGKEKFINGTTYEGDYANDTPNGKGIFTYSNGETYSGDVKNGHREGYGIYKAYNGQMYSGLWSNDQFVR